MTTRLPNFRAMRDDTLQHYINGMQGELKAAQALLAAAKREKRRRKARKKERAGKVVFKPLPMPSDRIH